MIDFLRFVFATLQAYRRARLTGSHYFAITRNGVPCVAAFVAVDREAWRVSQRAVEEFRLTR